jgi:hypothetical protein
MAKDPEELLLKIVGLTLLARGRVAMLMAIFIAPTVAIFLLLVAWRLLVG